MTKYFLALSIFLAVYQVRSEDQPSESYAPPASESNPAATTTSYSDVTPSPNTTKSAEATPPPAVTTPTPVSSGDTAAQNDPNKLVKPLGRIRSNTEPKTESSSFIAAPDNVDPLNPNRDNLKGDEEPVLETIKQQAPPAVPSSADGTKPVDVAPVEPEQKKKIVQEEAAEEAKNPDDPDLRLEKKFNRIYKTYNKNPTPDDVWEAANANQEAREYVVLKGDTLWSISNVLFGDPNFWPKLWALNKQGILNPHFINPGTIIYFYSGDEEYSPTLSLTDTTDELQKANEEAHAIYNPKDRPGKIPESIPLTRNERYFAKPYKQELIISLQVLPEFKVEYANDIFLTDSTLISDVKVDITEISRFRCYQGRLLKAIRFRKKMVDEYDILEPLESIKTKAGVLQTYKMFGTAVPYQDNYLKIVDCNSLMASNLVFLPKDAIKSLVTKRRSPAKAVSLIGGPDIVTQRFFIRNQIAYVDFGSRPFKPGDEYETQSQITDNINGKVKVIEKYGSFGVVMVTDIDDTMEIGDQLVFN